MDDVLDIHASLETAIRAVLLADWDPIGLHDLPQDMREANRDEYDAYIAPLAAMLCAGEGPAELAAYLQGIERDALGLCTQSGKSLAADNPLSGLRQSA